MKKLVAALTGILFSTAVFAQSELPTTMIKDVNTGKSIAFNKAVETGKVTLVSFWATWCVPCKKEIINIRKKMGDWKAEADFNFVTVSMDESRAEGLARSYSKAQGWDFPSYIDVKGDLKRSLNFQTIPFVIVIDKEGKIAYMHSGYEEGGENEVFAKIKELAN